MKRRTEITIETERTTFSEGSENIRETRWCKDCNAQTRHVSLDEASHLLHLSSKHILRLMGADCHQVNEKGGSNIFVCLNSLLVEVMLSLATKVSDPGVHRRNDRRVDRIQATLPTGLISSNF